MLNLTCFFPSYVAFSELPFDDEIWTNVVNSVRLETERKMFLANIFPQWPPVGFSVSSPFISEDPAERRNSPNTRILAHQGLKLVVESEAWTEQLHSRHLRNEAGSLAWKISFQLPGSSAVEIFSKQIPSGHSTGLFLPFAMQRKKDVRNHRAFFLLPLASRVPTATYHTFIFPSRGRKRQNNKIATPCFSRNPSEDAVAQVLWALCRKHWFTLCHFSFSGEKKEFDHCALTLCSA